MQGELRPAFPTLADDQRRSTGSMGAWVRIQSWPDGGKTAVTIERQAEKTPAKKLSGVRKRPVMAISFGKTVAALVAHHRNHQQP